MVKSLSELDLNKYYTYQDYLTWQLEGMVELIKGKVFKMSPPPNIFHQRVASRLHKEIAVFLETKSCEVFFAPFDVRLPSATEGNEIRTVVQPDICVVCNSNKLDIRGCLGAPDWIIEILSKSTAQKDLNDKYDLYEANGVQEYWIVHPSDGTVITYRLDEHKRFQPLRNKPFTSGETIPVSTFPGYELDLTLIF